MLSVHGSDFKEALVGVALVGELESPEALVGELQHPGFLVDGSGDDVPVGLETWVYKLEDPGIFRDHDGGEVPAKLLRVPDGPGVCGDDVELGHEALVDYRAGFSRDRGSNALAVTSEARVATGEGQGFVRDSGSNDDITVATSHQEGTRPNHYVSQLAEQNSAPEDGVVSDPPAMSVIVPNLFVDVSTPRSDPSNGMGSWDFHGGTPR